MKLTEQEMEEQLKALLKMDWITLYYDVENDREVYGSTQLGQEMYYAYTHWTNDGYDESMADHKLPIITKDQAMNFRNDLLMNKCLVERMDWSKKPPQKRYSATPMGHKLFQAWSYYQNIKKQRKMQDRKNLKNNLIKVAKGFIKMIQTMQTTTTQPPRHKQKKGKKGRGKTTSSVPDNPLPTDFWSNAKKNRGFWND